MRSIALRTLASHQGIGLVSAMLALSILALFSLVAAHLAVSERRTAFFEMVHTGAVFAADSGGEDAISWLTLHEGPPPITDYDAKRVATSTATSLHDSQEYQYDISFVRWQPRVGYDLSHVDFVYDVDSFGSFAERGNSNIGVIVRKLSRSGHQGY